ncbi:MAG: CoA transferase [Deltaproteobacteria bacterium]|nr:CoA transferase [Nannocystaceae bacterium]
MTRPRPPLEGVRVLDFTQNLPGPYATLVMASLGAEVIKVEPPGGDTARAMPSLFGIVNAGKRSIVLDLKQHDAATIIAGLVRDTDVLVEGFRPGVMARLGCDAAAARAINPRLVYCSISGYGQHGPYAGWPGHDLNFQALTGVCHMSRDQYDHPFGSALPIADLSSALTAVASVLAALFARERDGQGRAIDVAMVDTLLSWSHAWAEGLTPRGTTGARMLASARPWIERGAAALPGRMRPLAQRVAGWLGGDDGRRRADAIGAAVERSTVYRRLERLRLHALPHYGLFRTRDDRWLSIAIVDEHKFWRALCKGLALPRLAGVPLAARFVAAAPLRRTIAAAIRRHDLAHWLSNFERERVPIAAVLPIAESLVDPQLLARMGGGRFGAPAPLSTTSLGPAPSLGEHTESVLSALPR